MSKTRDDAMVVERMLSRPVKLFEGSYRNIKITTPDDLAILHAFRDHDIGGQTLSSGDYSGG